MNEKEIRKIKNQIWDIYYNELQNHCSKCPHYHVQSFEKMSNARLTTHRCKKLSTSHKDEYSRGYYPYLEIGIVCPISHKKITSKTIGEVIKISNNMVYLQAFKENNNSKLLKDIELFVLSK